MARGGHAASGPPPDPNSLKTAKSMQAGGWTTLPAEGRKGPAPEWPLVSPAERELNLWDELWARPQAVAWEQLGQELEVAMYVRNMAEAERRDARLDVRKIARQHMESLGLTVQGMLRNRWRIAPAAEDEPPAPAKGSKAPARRTARTRLKVVPSGSGD